MLPEPMTYFRPVLHEGKPIFIVNFVEGSERYSGAEALRRKSTSFNSFLNSRIAGGPWIIPLVKLDLDHPRERPEFPDIYFFGGRFHVTNRALEVIRSFCHRVPGRHVTEDIEFLPVELQEGGYLWLVNPALLEDALEEARSGLIRAGKFGQMVSIREPVLLRRNLTKDHIFAPLKKQNAPILSGALVQALQTNGICGQFDWTPVEVVED